MSLKTQAHTGQANSNIRTQTEPIPKSQTVGLSKPKQTQTEEPQPLSPSQEPTLSPSRRQFIEQYGAYALVTPVALYAMMSPNRAMAQAASVGVIDPRPRVLINNERIENFDITTHIDGIIDEDGDLELLQDEKYIAPDGVTYTCGKINGCYISPTEGGGGRAAYGSQFDITYPDDIGSSDQAVDDVAAAVDDVVADARPTVLNNDERIENFDITTHTDGDITLDGDLALREGEKYIAPDGVVYTCSSYGCVIIPTEGGGAKADYDSTFDITYPDDIGSSDQVVADAVDDTVADTTDDVVADPMDDDTTDDPVVDDRPTVLNNNERIKNFDTTTVIEGHVNIGGELLLLNGQKYTAPDGIVYTCVLSRCYISPLPGGGGFAAWNSTFDITYPNDIGSSDQAVDDVAADATDDDSPRFLVRGERIETFDLDTATNGIVYTVSDGDVVHFLKGAKYTAPDGVVYTCTATICVVNPMGETILGIFSYRPR